MNIKILIVSVLSCMALLPLGGEETLPTVSVIPAPESVCLSQGYFVFGSDTQIHCPQEFVTRAEIISDVIKTFTGIAPKVKPVKKQAREGICFTLSDREYMPQGGYRMEVTQESIRIISNTVEGLFYGGQTLVQLIPADGRELRIPCVEISDSPRYAWRGYMHDVSRTFFSTDVLKKYIDVMSLFKLNVLHLHLTDDQGWRIEIRKYPKLTEPLSTEFDASCGEPSERSGYYTQEEIKDLVAYASERNVTIVPEIDVPGHSWATLLAYPELGVNDKAEPHYVFPFLDGWSYWGTQFSPNTLDPTDERVYEFLGGVFSEIAELFPSEYIHFGGDEAKHYIWGEQPHVVKYMEDHGMKTTADLQAMFVSKVCDIIRSKGKTPIGWNDILRDSENLTENTAIMSWLGAEAVKQAAMKGMYTVAVPADLLYLDVAQADRNDGTKTDLGYEMINSMERIYAYDPAEGLSEDETGYVLGVQGNIWTHIARDVKDVNVQLFPRLLAVAEVGWSLPENKSLQDFLTRVEDNLPRLDSLKVDYYRPGGYIAGIWNLCGMSDEVLEWDVTSKVYASGRVSAGFYYLGGGSFLEIDGVELLQDGKVISSDCHDGLADTFRATHKKKTYLYDLEVENYDPSSKYVLRAKVSTELDGPSYGNFTFSLSPYEPFSVTETTSGKKRCPVGKCSMEVDRMTCEYIENPMGLDVRSPRFSWTLEAANPDSYGHRQTAYMIEVSALLPSGKKSVQWNTGWVCSDDTQLIPYEGAPLSSDTDYLWRVKVRDEDGRESRWSKDAKWSTGLFSPSEWSAEWIGSDEIFDPAVEPDCNISDPWLRKTVIIEKRPVRAVMFVASLGYHELYVNGEKIGEDVLAPVVTDHSKRARYVAYDIAPFLKKGENVIGLWLGASWSVYAGYRTEDKPQTPMALAQADVYYNGNDGASFRIITDSTWKTRPSPNKLLGKWGMGSMGGELYDARKEISDWAELSCDESGWKSATVYSPLLEISATATYPNRKDTPVTPIKVEEMPNGDYRVDMGTNFAGWVEIDVSGNPGDTIDFLYSEREYMEMTFRNYSAYVIGESGHGTFRNRFNYGSGRWITIKGLKEKPELSDIRGWMVRTVHPRTTEFTCSDDLQNWIYDRVKWTFENLSIGGYIVDCPQRERLGYGDAAYISCETGMFNYALGSLYTKWMQDWRDVQGRQSNMKPRIGGGILPHSAPTYDGGGGPGWGSCTVIVPWLVYCHYTDMRILEDNFGMISAWLDFLDSHTEDGILKRWGGTWDYLADWLWPGATAEGMNNDKPQAECFNSCYYAFDLATAAEIAKVLGREKEAAIWAERADDVRKAVHRKFFNADDCSYSDRSMGNLAIALLAGVPPAELRPKVMERLEKEILVNCNGHIDVGIIGGGILFQLLREAGRDDIIWSMTSQTGYPGWGNMRAHGATTLWEMWEPDLPGHSLCHGSFLYPGAWYIDGLAGIKRGNAIGFSEFTIKAPRLPENSVTSASATYDSPVGTIVSSWKIEGENFTHEVFVPANASAVVYIPCKSPETVTEASGYAEYTGMSDSYAVYKVPSGKYVFKSSI